MQISINHNAMSAGAARHLGMHFNSLAGSVRRMSSGLRVSRAADDAAGLAIRELVRANIAVYGQGIRNASDAISMLQTADGALAIIDEKLIRMKELSVQAATGTYNSDQRLIIDSEFQAMASEIQRIALATNFNGIKLLDGSLCGGHDGSGLLSKGALKVHFGTGNDSAEDYYYLSIGEATLGGLGLAQSSISIGNTKLLNEVLDNGGALKYFNSGVISFAVVPTGTTNLRLYLNDAGANDTIQIFTRSGRHIAGTALNSTGDWASAGVSSVAGMNSRVLTEANGFLPGAVYDDSALNGSGTNLPYNATAPYNQFQYSGMNLEYSGDGNPYSGGVVLEYLNIDSVTEELIVLVAGSGVFSIRASWGDMPPLASGATQGISTPAIRIETQTKGQEALERLNKAIVVKDKIRAHIGAMQNRLENTISNLQIQAENLQASESRISDVDVASEMTAFVRNRILTEAATAMLAQANSISQIALSLIRP